MLGDVGDFAKYGLLRQLAGHFDDLPSLVLGVIWYKVPDESHNNDGGKIHYLANHTRNSHVLEICDPDLYNNLQKRVPLRRKRASGMNAVSMPALGRSDPNDLRHFRESFGNTWRRDRICARCAGADPARTRSAREGARSFPGAASTEPERQPRHQVSPLARTARAASRRRGRPLDS